MPDLDKTALTTLENVAREVDVTVGSDTDTDNLLRDYIRAASEAFVQATGRQFFKKDSHVEYVRAYGDSLIFVEEHIPIASINSIEYDNGDYQVDIPADDYMIEDADVGSIRKLAGYWSYTGRHHQGVREVAVVGSERPLIKVDYDGGYYTPKQAELEGEVRDLPYNIERAIISRVVKMYKMKGRDPTVTSETIGSVSVTYAQKAGEDESTFSPWSQAVAKYKRGGFR